MSGCPPCKVILDGGVVRTAAESYAGTVASISASFGHAIAIGTFDAAQIDEAHALSELWCHRAALLRKWAEEDRLHATGMIGGEYAGAWMIDGVEGIRLASCGTAPVAPSDSEFPQPT